MGTLAALEHTGDLAYILDLSASVKCTAVLKTFDREYVKFPNSNQFIRIRPNTEHVTPPTECGLKLPQMQIAIQNLQSPRKTELLPRVTPFWEASGSPQNFLLNVYCAEAKAYYTVYAILEGQQPIYTRAPERLLQAGVPGLD